MRDRSGQSINNGLPEVGNEDVLSRHSFRHDDARPYRDCAAFLSAHGFEDLGHSKVRFVIPKGGTVIALLDQAEALYREQTGRHALHPNRLKEWRTDRAFTEAATQKLEIGIEALVPDASWFNAETQKEMMKEEGRQLPSKAHLAAAHALYLVATGKDLFQGNVVRCSDYGLLCFSSKGLGRSGIFSKDDGCVRDGDGAHCAAMIST